MSALCQERTFQRPTATEVFRLRSVCAELGERILQSNVIGSALYQQQVSHYDERTNRCYVELTVQNAQSPDLYINRNLFDGQTKELLAFARIEKGQKVGMVFDRQHVIKYNLKNAGWDDASEYIDERMIEDRK